MEEEKKTLKERWNEWKPVKYFKEHPDIGLYLLGGMCTLAGGIMKVWAVKHEYEDQLFVGSTEGEVYSIPAKKMDTADHLTTF